MPFRPTVVIGLGGSGKWLIAHLKRALMEKNEGEVPKEVFLLSIDLSKPSDERPMAMVSVFDPKNYAKKGVYADDQKTPTEFLDISGLWAEPILDILRKKRGRQNPATPLIAKWLDKEDAGRYNLSLTDLHNRGGAGQKRQGSRVALFLNVERLWRILQDGVTRVREFINATQPAQQEAQKVNFFVFSSLAGGTGCGIFLDIFYLLYQAIRRAGLDERPGVNIFGIFVLPRAYERVSKETARMNANCYAAFREMQTTLFQAGYPISYTTSPDLRDIQKVEPEARILSFCYLVDGYNLGNIHPFQEGVVPMVADFIFSHIIAPPHSGYPNLLAGIEGRTRDMEDITTSPLYSTFGIYSYIFPVEEVIQTLAHKLALEVLQHFLTRVKDDIEVQNQAQYFRNDMSNTPFNRQVVKSLLEQPEDTTLIAYPAPLYNMRMKTNKDTGYPQFSTENIPTSKPLRRVASSEVIKRAVTREQTFNKELKKALDDCLDNNLREFEGHLKEKIKQILNSGEKGCLDFAGRFVQELINAYIQAGKNLTDMIRKAGIDDKEKRVSKEVEDLKNKLTKSDKGIYQKAFLDAFARQVEIKSLIKVLEYVRKILEGYTDICLQIFNEVHSWILTFQAGIDIVKKAYEEQIEVRQEKEHLAGRNYVTLPDDQWENKIYDFILSRQKPSSDVETQINDKLGHKDFQNDIISYFTWEFKDMELCCSLPAEFAPQDFLEELHRKRKYRESGGISANEWNEFALRWNYNFVNNFIQKAQLDSIVNIGVLDILTWQGKHSNIDAFLQDMETRADPICQRPTVLSDDSQEWRQITTDLAVATPPGDHFLNDLRNFCSNRRIEILDSGDRYQLTFTRYLHLLKGEEISTLQSAENYYWDWLGELYDMNQNIPIHNIPHHRNASYYEHRLGLDRCLNLKITRWLEDKEIVKTLALAYAFDLIKKEWNASTGRDEYRFGETWIGEKLTDIIRRINEDANLFNELKDKVEEYRKSKTPDDICNIIDGAIKTLNGSIDSKAKDGETDLMRVLSSVLEEVKPK